MLGVAALLLQLSLWVATVHAFFPFIPTDQCNPSENCGSSGSKRDDHGVGQPAEGITFDLHRRPRGPDDPAANSVAHAVARLARKFGGQQPSPASELDKRKNTYSVSAPADPTTSNSAGIYQYGPDYSYFIKVQVGAAQQPLYMLLDTGAANSWIMGSDCQSDACKIHNTFDSSTSKSWRTDKKPFSIIYGTGSLTGHVGQDTISLAGLTLDMSFGLANYTNDEFKHFAFDGILGLTMSASVTGNFLQTLKSKKLVSSLIVGMSFNRDSDGPNTGQVTFGGVDPAKYTGAISYTPVQSPSKENGDWAIPLDGVSFDGQTAPIASREAYLDTGTSFAFAPPADLAFLFKLIPGSSSGQNGDFVEYYIPCDTSLPITVTFSGVSYDIAAADWVVRKDEKTCLSRIYGYEVRKGTWLLGDTFLKNVYSVFDADKMRIGLAKKPAPSPRPSSTGAPTVASATTVSPAVSTLAGDGHPIMPGLGSSQGTAVPGSDPTAVSSPAAQGTDVSGGSKVGMGAWGLGLGVAAAVMGVMA
ncbi:hypothetical protein N0V88_000543 [Collariella sp. IMI 366227]|nr:hypothetical protein N0V88_000543 [Collariella sp. IMI 366227]